MKKAYDDMFVNDEPLHIQSLSDFRGPGDNQAPNGPNQRNAASSKQALYLKSLAAKDKYTPPERSIPLERRTAKGGLEISYAQVTSQSQSAPPRDWQMNRSSDTPKVRKIVQRIIEEHEEENLPLEIKEVK